MIQDSRVGRVKYVGRRASASPASGSAHRTLGGTAGHPSRSANDLTGWVDIAPYCYQLRQLRTANKKRRSPKGERLFTPL